MNNLKVRVRASTYECRNLFGIRCNEWINDRRVRAGLELTQTKQKTKFRVSNREEENVKPWQKENTDATYRSLKTISELCISIQFRSLQM